MKRELSIRYFAIRAIAALVAVSSTSAIADPFILKLPGNAVAKALSPTSLTRGADDRSRVNMLSDAYLINSDKLTVASVDEVVMSNEKQSSASSYFRTYLGAQNFDNPNTYRNMEMLDESGEIASRYVAYQSTMVFSKYLLKSPMGNFYNDVLHFFRRTRDYTSVTVRRDSTGELNLGKTDSNDKPLLDLRINADSRGRIEPRIRIGGNVLLRHDMQDSATILEYNVNF